MQLLLKGVPFYRPPDKQHSQEERRFQDRMDTRDKGQHGMARGPASAGGWLEALAGRKVMALEPAAMTDAATT